PDRRTPRCWPPRTLILAWYPGSVKVGDYIADRFVIERLSAAGGMAAIWRAIDKHTDRLAAIKVVAVSDAHGFERFVREARALDELRHPGIVQYLAHGRSDGELYIAMEWLEGEDLGARLTKHELGLADSVLVITQIAAALAVVHARQIVHRDIKPSNIFLCDGLSLKCKLLDFCVAARARPEPLTATGHIVGTPSYMSPEQARGAKNIDARADVFALGGVFFRCLTGRPPFMGRTAPEIVLQVLCDEVPR